MKKKWSITFGILTLSAVLVGCNADKKTTANAENTHETVVETNSTESPETEDTNSTEESVNQAEELPSNEISSETPPLEEDTNIKEEESSSSDNISDSSTYPSTENKIEEEKKPASSTNTAQNSTGNSTSNQTPSKPVTSKPNTNKPNTSKPNTSKPSTNQKPSNSTPSVGENTDSTTKPSTEDQNTPTPAPADSLSCSTIFNKVTNNMDTSAHLAMDASLLSDYYGIDASLLEDYCVYLPMMSTSITEIGVFKVKDVQNVDTILSGINKRAGDVGAMLYPSLEATYESRKVVTNGNYILFAISDAASSMASAFNSLF